MITFDSLLGKNKTFDNPTLKNLYQQNQRNYDKILELVKNNTIIPFIGAGFSAGAYPTWNNLISEMAEPYPNCINEVNSHLKKGEFEEAASALCNEMSRNTFLTSICQKFSEDKLEQSLSKTTAERRLLPHIFKGNVFTTNFDKIIDEIYDRKRTLICPHTEYQQQSINNRLQQNSPALVKLHGDISDSSNIIITKQDYDRFYGTNNLEVNMPLVKTLRLLLQSRPVLFLGCSITSDRFLKVLSECSETTRAYFALIELPKETVNDNDPFSPFLLKSDGYENEEYRKRRQFLANNNIHCIWYPYGIYEALDIFLKHLYDDLNPDVAASLNQNKIVIPSRHIIGRDDDINKIYQKLVQENKPIFVTGTGGIGKTEVCNSVINLYCKEHSSFAMKYVEVFGVETLQTLCSNTAKALGIATLSDEFSINQYFKYLTAEAVKQNKNNGCGFYFDNWEDIWYALSKDEDSCMELLNWFEELSQNNICVLVSSRVFPKEFDFSLCNCEIFPLDCSKQYDRMLFEKVYHQKGGHLIMQGDEFNELLHNLGGHPLSIVLVATQAASKLSWKDVLDVWVTAKKKGKNPRHNQLDVALRISWDAIYSTPCCVEVWGILALSLDNPSIEQIESLYNSDNEICLWKEALSKLYDENLLDLTDDNKIICMIPPIKEVFFILASEEITKQCFKRWVDYFLILTNHSEVSYPDHIKSHPVLVAKLSQALHILSRLLHKPIFHDFIIELGYNLSNYYQFQVITSVKVLQNMISYAKIQTNLHLWAFASQHCGNLKYRLGQLNEAMKLYSEAEGYYRSEQDKLKLANVLKSMGNLKRLLGQLDEAMKLYSEAEEHYRSLQDKLGLANVLKSMGDLKMQLGQLDEAMKLYSEAEGYYRSLQDNLGLANVFLSMGDLKMQLGQLDEAMKLYSEAEGYYRSVQNKLGLANVFLSMGNLKMQLGQLDEAMKLYSEAEGYYRSEQDKLGLANVLKSMGDLKMQLGQLDEAMKLYRKAEEHYRSEQDKLGLANVLKSTGNLKMQLGQLDEAMKLYKKAEEHYCSEQDKLGLANVFLSMGDLYIQNNEIEKAIDTYNSALSLYKMEKNKLGLAYTLTELCYSYSLFGNGNEVHNLAQSILDIIKEFPYEHAKKYIQERISSALSRCSN